MSGGPGGRSPFVMGCSILCRRGKRLHGVIPGTSQTRGWESIFRALLWDSPSTGPHIQHLKHQLAGAYFRQVGSWMVCKQPSHLCTFGQWWWKRSCCGDHQAFAKCPSIHPGRCSWSWQEASDMTGRDARKIGAAGWKLWNSSPNICCYF